ncbi:hypothetical protein H0H87_012983 [Tephrocybe sp. NHM501043]|nr:hypothetical protein H0H87_012983 [Tephrocybe sp. NHM501043]
MKLSLVFAVLLATGSLAVPSSSERVTARLERRRAARQSQPNNRLVSNNAFEVAASNVSHVEYSSNWAGAVLETSPSVRKLPLIIAHTISPSVGAQGAFKSVTGTFTVPTPKGSGAAAVWVGIDGDTCESAILQTGIDFIASNGAISYHAWYEWFPDSSNDFSNIAIKAGDVMTVTVTATSTKSGSAVITNKTTGKSVSKSLTSTAALCQQNAEWIVEDFESGGSLVPLANFGTVEFTGAVATTSTGTTVGPRGATVFDIQQNGKVLTSVSTSSSGVTVSHV